MNQNKTSAGLDSDNSQTSENHFESNSKSNELGNDSDDTNHDLNKKQVDLLLAAARQRGLRA